MTKANMNWRDLSELCFGLLIAGRVDMSKFSAALFCDGYEEGFNEWFKTKNRTSTARVLGADYEVAIQAAETISESSSEDVEWHKLLRRSMMDYSLALKLERQVKKLKSGQGLSQEEAVDTIGCFKDLSNPEASGLINAKDVDIENYHPTEPSGYLPVDTHLGGIVKAGNIQVMATTGSGKSLYSQVFWGNYLDYYRERTIAVWSLEMGNEDYLYRGKNLYPKFWKAVQEGRVLISDKTTNIHDIGLEAASSRVNAIIVDYADYLPEGAQDESGMGIIYRTQNNISRDLKIPFMMLLQPNRSSYTSGVPRMQHARYSGMAENIAAQFWVIYRPKNEEDTNGDFVYVEDSVYLVCWKQRFGWLRANQAKEMQRTWMPEHDGRGRKGPGAIVLPETDNVWADDVAGDWILHGEIPMSMKKKRRSE